ncbi:MAG: TenA family protein [Proteobacteria bacterium]|nr:TenA family protein [Pseudomonadota bacterium]
MTVLDEIAPPGGLFLRLRAAAAGEWAAYTEHPFVARLAAGDLPEASFRHYLGQDYLFLIHFARAYALAAYKSDSLEDIRQAAGGVKAILEDEIGLHVAFCAGWGLDEAAMAALPEAAETMAYTRYVLERGLAGDLLDLHVALAPCVLGYAEIGRRIAREKGATLAGNPYRTWIEMYADEEYGGVARAEAEQLDRVLLRRTGLRASEIEGTARWNSLVTTFREACRLEASFWQMGLDAA